MSGRRRHTSRVVLGAERADRVVTRAAASWYSAIQLIAKVLGFALVILAARAARPKEFGGFTAAILLSAVFALVVEFGASAAVVRVATLHHDDPALPAFVTKRCFVLWGVAALGLVATLATAGAPTAQWVVLVLTVAVLIACNMVTASALLGLGFGVRAALPNLLFNIVGASLAAALALSNPGHASANALFFTYLLGSAAASVTSAVFLRRMGFLRVAQLRGSLFGSPDTGLVRRTGLVQLVQYLTNYVDQFAAGAIGGATTLGVYGLASRFEDTATAVPSIVTVAFQPHFIRGMTSGDRQRFFRRAIDFSVILCAGLGAIVAFLGPVVVRLFASQSYAPAGVLVTILSAGMFAYALQTVAFFMVRGASGSELSTSLTTTVFVARAALTTVFVVIALEFGGVQALAVARAGTDTVFLLAIAAVLAHRIGLHVPFVTLMSAVVALAGVMAPYLGASSVLAAALIAVPAAISACNLVRQSDRSVAPEAGHAPPSLPTDEEAWLQSVMGQAAQAADVSSRATGALDADSNVVALHVSVAPTPEHGVRVESARGEEP